MPTKKIEESVVTEAPKVETKPEEKKSEVEEAPKMETVAPVIEAKKAEKTEKAGFPEEKKEEAPKDENPEIKPVAEKSKTE